MNIQIRFLSYPTIRKEFYVLTSLCHQVQFSRKISNLDLSDFVSILPRFFGDFSFIFHVFIQIHDYSNKIRFISDHKVRVPCYSITLISDLVL